MDSTTSWLHASDGDIHSTNTKCLSFEEHVDLLWNLANRPGIDHQVPELYAQQHLSDAEDIKESTQLTFILILTDKVTRRRVVGIPTIAFNCRRIPKAAKRYLCHTSFALQRSGFPSSLTCSEGWLNKVERSYGITLFGCESLCTAKRENFPIFSHSLPTSSYMLYRFQYDKLDRNLLDYWLKGKRLDVHVDETRFLQRALILYKRFDDFKQWRHPCFGHTVCGRYAIVCGRYASFVPKPHDMSECVPH